jgi:soluble lytic murein transglycosylase-like protein
MVALGRAALFAAAAASPATGVAQPWSSYVEEAALRYSLPKTWIERVMMAESGGRTVVGGRPVTSSAGAMGLMQLMPGTWAQVRQSQRLGRDPYDPHDNIIAGAAYLRQMYDRFGYPGMFAAYNAGPARYALYLAGTQLPSETRLYVRKITGSGAGLAPGPVTAAQASARYLGAGQNKRASTNLLFAIRSAAATRSGAASAAAVDGLFAIRAR